MSPWTAHRYRNIIDVVSSIERLIQEAGDLPHDEKLALANRVLALAEPVETESVRNRWDIEIRDRIRSYDDGNSSTRLAGEVFRDLDAKLAIAG